MTEDLNRWEILPDDLNSNATNLLWHSCSSLFPNELLQHPCTKGTKGWQCIWCGVWAPQIVTLLADLCKCEDYFS